MRLQPGFWTDRSPCTRSKWWKHTIKLAHLHFSSYYVFSNHLKNIRLDAIITVVWWSSDGSTILLGVANFRNKLYDGRYVRYRSSVSVYSLFGSAHLFFFHSYIYCKTILFEWSIETKIMVWGHLLVCCVNVETDFAKTICKQTRSISTCAPWPSCFIHGWQQHVNVCQRSIVTAYQRTGPSDQNCLVWTLWHV